MNKDQDKGAIKDASGKLQAKSGPAMGSDAEHAKSVTPHAAGHDPKKAGDGLSVAKDRPAKL